MLYHLREMQRSLLNPVTQWADISSKLFSSPISLLADAPFAQRVVAGCNLICNLGNHYEKPQFEIDSTLVDGKPVRIVEHSEVTKAFCRLIHFEKDLSEKEVRALAQPKVLLVAPLSGNHATLLRDTVRALLSDHDVYITDWTDARMVPLSEGAFHLEDYIFYVQEFIRLLGPDLHVISISQPSVPVLAAISLMATANDPKLPKTMTMMAGPIDPRRSPTQVTNLITIEKFPWLENTVIYSVPPNYPGFGRKVFPGFLQHGGFMAVNMYLETGDCDPAEGHRQFYNEFNAVLDMPAEYYLETIQTVFQEFLLPKGTWAVKGQLVRPQDIKDVALLTVEGELDDVCGAGQTQAAHELCSGIAAQMKQDFVVPQCGHYGIFSGRRWREMICPEIGAFIKKHS